MEKREICCPICRETVQPLGENKSFPFCSRRCKLIDLGKWFEEGYSIPDRPAPDPTAPSPDDEY
ncbi:MAG: DNA gyrase inhibitor YacG [Bradymonadaceae bacterium]